MAAGQLGDGRTQGRRWRLGGVPVLMYHGLVAGAAPGVPGRERKYWVPADLFRDHLAALRRSGQRLGTLPALWQRWVPDTSGRPPVVLTFDDGRASDYQVAFPALQDTGGRADFFVNPATVGRAGYLTWAELGEMHRAGMSVQSHGREHMDLTRLPARELDEQLRASKQELEDRLGVAVRFLAAPLGRVSRRVVDAASKAGYAAVCTSRAWPSRLDGGPIGRVAIYRHTAPADVARIAAGAPGPYLARLGRGALLALPKRFWRALRPGLGGAPRPPAEPLLAGPQPLGRREGR